LGVGFFGSCGVDFVVFLGILGDAIFWFFLLVVVAVCYALLCLQLFQAAIEVLLQLQIVAESWLWLEVGLKGSFFSN
jgi:hypothetical protein